MKNLYQITRHLVWLTQFGLSVALPPVLFLLGAVWLKNEFALGGWVVLVGLLLGLAALALTGLVLWVVWSSLDTLWSAARGLLP